MKIKILIPVYNDWQSVAKLISEIDDLAKNINHEISIIVVNGPNGVAWEAYHTMEDAEIFNTAGARSDTEKKGYC